MSGSCNRGRSWVVCVESLRGGVWASGNVCLNMAGEGACWMVLRQEMTELCVECLLKHWLLELGEEMTVWVPGCVLQRWLLGVRWMMLREE